MINYHYSVISTDERHDSFRHNFPIGEFVQHGDEIDASASRSQNRHPLDTPKGKKPAVEVHEEAGMVLKQPIDIVTRPDDKNIDMVDDSNAYNTTLYRMQVHQTLEPIANKSTVYLYQRFWAGFCNQYMMFVGVIYKTQDAHHEQFIEDSMQFKDTYGTEHYIPFQNLFDVVHWNSFYPALPRFVRYDRNLHLDANMFVPEVTIAGKRYSSGAHLSGNVTRVGSTERNFFDNSTNPKPIIFLPREMNNRYKQVIKKVVQNRKRNEEGATLDASHALILKEALRPHPEIQSMIDANADVLRNGSLQEKFMVLHARVEFDMVRLPFNMILSFKH